MMDSLDQTKVNEAAEEVVPVEEENVEEVSQQMKPARKRKVKNGKVN